MIRRSLYRMLIFMVLIILVGGIYLLHSGYIYCKAYDSDYGVYIGANPEDIDPGFLPQTIVIDAQYFSEDEIHSLKEEGHTVYSYLNLGSIENFRDYYSQYESLTLGTYENWEDEKWINVSNKRWQRFFSKKADELLAKGVDGFFVDNCDVYYNYPTEEIFTGVSTMLKDLKSKNAYVLINGGDTFVLEYLARNESLDDVLDGVNQESVYTTINWDDESFEVNNKENREYFSNYLDTIVAEGKDAYALEYATDEKIADAAFKYAKRKGYGVYISDSLELN